MIQIENLSKRYGGTTAVDGITFTARPGSVTGFLGPNGAGKSTAMRMMAGLTVPTGGRALVLGRLLYAGHDVGTTLRRVRSDHRQLGDIVAQHDDRLRILNPGSPTDRRRQPVCTYLTASVTAGTLADVRLHPLPPRER